MAKKAKKKAVRRTMRILPRKMSSLIKIALADIRKAEKSPKYFVDMDVYHDPDEIVCRVKDNTINRTPTCVVCAAGSVMAFSLKAKPNVSVGPGHFKGNEDQLQAIDDLRCGQVTSAAERLGIINSHVIEDSVHAKAMNAIYDLTVDNFPDYEFDEPEPFHKAMQKLETQLRKVGL